MAFSIFFSKSNKKRDVRWERGLEMLYLKCGGNGGSIALGKDWTANFYFSLKSWKERRVFTI